MIGSATPVIVGALVFLCLATAVVLAAGFYGWRWARRRLLVARAAWRNVERVWMGTRTGRTLLGRLHQSGSRHPVGGTGAPAGDLRTVPLPEVRRQLWQGVGAAEGAVSDAVAAGAPVGDLPSLGRRLRSTAEALDRLLAAGDDRHLAGVRRQVADVLSTAAAIRSAATAVTVAVVSDATEMHLRDLVADTDREVHSLAAGMDRYTRHRG